LVQRCSDLPILHYVTKQTKRISCSLRVRGLNKSLLLVLLWPGLCKIATRSLFWRDSYCVRPRSDSTSSNTLTCFKDCKVCAVVRMRHCHQNTHRIDVCCFFRRCDGGERQGVGNFESLGSDFQCLFSFVFFDNVLRRIPFFFSMVQECLKLACKAW